MPWLPVEIPGQRNNLLISQTLGMPVHDGGSALTGFEGLHLTDEMFGLQACEDWRTANTVAVGSMTGSTGGRHQTGVLELNLICRLLIFIAGPNTA
jgi:hypothetical protein